MISIVDRWVLSAARTESATVAAVATSNSSNTDSAIHKIVRKKLSKGAIQLLWVSTRALDV